MSDAAARRRTRILSGSKDRMKLVSGSSIQDKSEVDAPPEAAYDLASGGKEEAEDSNVSEVGTSKEAGIRARNRRRLQARNIKIETVPTEADHLNAGQSDMPPGTNDTPLGGSEKRSSSPSLLPYEGFSHSASNTGALTTGGNVLRKRFQASRYGDRGATATDANAGVSSRPENPTSPAPSLLQALTASDVLLRLWPLCAAGLLFGVWVAGLNATVLARVRASTGMESPAHHQARDALDEFVANVGAISPPNIGGDKDYLGLWDRDRIGANVLRRIRNLFLPEVFDSFPLPLIALILHGVLIFSLGMLRVTSRKGTAGDNIKDWASTVPLEGEGGGESGREGETGAKASLDQVSDRSMLASLAHTFGLGPALEALKVLQAAWQDMLIFSFFFLLALALCA